MPETIKMLLVLTLISAAAGLGLAAFSAHTAPAIENNLREYTLASIKKVIPDSEKPNPCEKTKPRFDNSPDQDAVCIDKTLIYRARVGEEPTGFAFVTKGDNAYTKPITCLVGLSLDGMVTGIEVLEHAETPGLGAKIETCKWRSQLIGKDPAKMVWKVAKDGGPVDEISGATISSRAMINAIEKALKLYGEKKNEIISSEPMKQGEVCDGK